MILTIVLQDVTIEGKWVKDTQDLLCANLQVSQNQCLLSKNEIYFAGMCFMYWREDFALADNLAIITSKTAILS